MTNSQQTRKKHLNIHPPKTNPHTSTQIKKIKINKQETKNKTPKAGKSSPQQTEIKPKHQPRSNKSIQPNTKSTPTNFNLHKPIPQPNPKNKTTNKTPKHPNDKAVTQPEIKTKITKPQTCTISLKQRNPKHQFQINFCLTPTPKTSFPARKHQSQQSY